MSRIVVAVLLVMPVIGVADAQPKRGEFLQMFDAVVSGSQMGPGDGWFKPSQSRFTWERFRRTFDKGNAGRVTAKKFAGSPELFESLDRDGDGAITADDLDWSDSAPYFRQLSVAQQLLRRIDENGDRKLSKEEWMAAFNKAAKGKNTLDPEAVRRILYPPTPPFTFKKSGGGPSKETLLLGLLTGELGSGAEGPTLEGMAPDFTLPTPTGKATITLADYRNKKPVVLIFGSFT